MKYLTFGEIMLRLRAPGHERFFQSNMMEATFGGGEANVAVSLANYGEDAAYLTVLPNNTLGDECIRELRRFGVDTKRILRGPGRMGIYFLEAGANQLPSKVVYDRAYSAIALAKPGDIDWDAAFADVDWFHITGITPAISESAMELSLESVREAKKRGITVSCDLNYRKNLWSEEKAKSVMEELVRYVDVLIANEEDADKVLGIRASDTDVTTGKLNKAGYVDVAGQICEKYGVKKVGITLRKSISASDNLWSAMLYDGGQSYFSKEYPVHIVNRVGGGDSFTAGLIYALGNEYEPQSAVEFAVAASCLKHSIELDFNLVTVDEVKKLAGGDGSGRVQR